MLFQSVWTNHVNCAVEEPGDKNLKKKKEEEEEEPGAWVVTAIALVPAAVGNFRVIQARGPAVT